ncbi:MAG: hypothetical protein JW934_22860 [Anaerolineae bacterium]|nr:hypothetical protein [Anaerolineae bacterium]
MDKRQKLGKHYLGWFVCIGVIVFFLLTAQTRPSQADALTSTPTATLTMTPSPSVAVTATVTATISPAREGKASLKVGDAVLPVQGTKRVQIFVALRNVQPGICGLVLHLTFDPAVVQIVDADGNAENGVQIETDVAWFGGQVESNQIDNETGSIQLTVSQTDCMPLIDTGGWRKVAAIDWQGLVEGEFALGAGTATEFILSDGTRTSPNEVGAGTVSVRSQGQIQGGVFLQGQTVHQGAEIVATLSSGPGDRAITANDGTFLLPASQGEGFYTLVASHPGYLAAQSSTPVQVTLGRSVTVAPVTLLGGDVNGDGRIDVRDLAFVAWHFEQYDAAADINSDGQVDILDLTITAGNYGQQGPTLWVISDSR